MSYIQRERVTVTTSSDGAATGYSNNLTGKLHALNYYTGTLSTATTLTVTVEATSETIFSSTAFVGDTSQYFRPRVPICSTIGVTTANLGGAHDYILLANERVKFVISGGGDIKTGIFDVLVS